MSKKITTISFVSIAKIVPIIYLITGLVVGIISFLYLKIFTTPANPSIRIWEWFLAILIYCLLFCVILSGITFIIIYCYNLLSPKIGPIEYDTIEE
ncbi:MAG: hypothetical protein LBF97_05275 [Elusimicrobiota bacterium]|jgi:multisubunit Na+/H+ antiporter MnhE subunit|nr:hypothetical protein [Elusimicrobiota bacterium]